MLFFLLKRFFSVAFALLTLTLSLFACGLLKDGFSLSSLENAAVAKSYYLYSASSVAQETGSLELLELPFVEGKSVSILFESEKEAREYVAGLIEKTGANLQKAEYVEEAESYYLFSRGMGKTVAVSGLPVNLHVAISGKRVSVGSPIIFGGY